MYEPSVDFYTNVVQAQARRITWGGTVTADGVSYPFTAENIAKGSGRITNEISGSNMELGTVYSSELEIGLWIDDIGIPRNKIYGAEIALSCTLTANNETGTIPMGFFKVVEATQKGQLCSITAYDRMILFDAEYPVESGASKPYEWALNFCGACGVTLGTTEEEFELLPNGDLVLMLTWVDNIETYRTALGMLAAAIGCSAHFDRNGELVFLPLTNSASVATMDANDRFGSDIAQTEWTPSSVYVTNTETGNITKAGNGSLMLNLEENTFLQSPAQVRNLQWEYTDEVPVLDLLGNILTSAHSLAAVPIEADIPLDPCLDLFDVVTLTGGQANNTKIIITTLIHTIGGATEIKCSGANTTEEPKPSSKSGSNKDDIFWLTSALSGEVEFGTLVYTWESVDDKTWAELGAFTWGELNEGGTEHIVAQTMFNPPKEMSRGVVSFSVNYELDEDAEITYAIYIDEGLGDDLVWRVTETQAAGKIAKTITTPVKIWTREPNYYVITAKMAGVSNG